MSAFVRARKPRRCDRPRAAQPRPAPRRGGGRHRAAPRGGRRLRHHGRAPGRRQRRGGAAGEHAGDRRGARRAHPDLRADLGRALQSGRHAGRRLAGRAGVGEVPPYVAAQIAGAFAGVAAAHLMFEAPLFFASRHARAGTAQVFSEFVATFGLLAVIWGCARVARRAVPFAVAAYITAAYWFTASTSFANPGGDAGAIGDRYLRRHPPRRRAGLHRRAAARRRARPPRSSAGWPPRREPFPPSMARCGAA